MTSEALSSADMPNLSEQGLRVLFDRETVFSAIDRVAAEITQCYQAFETVNLVPVITGGMQFAAALLQAHRADEAIARLDDVLKRTPTLPNGRIVMAKAHAVAGRPQIAMEAAKAGLRHNPGHPQLRQLSSDLSRGAQGRSNQENDT